MIYLSDKDINDLPFDWNASIDVIERAVNCIDVNDYVQPIKTYLRYNDRTNRIIAMPAYAGGEITKSGLKWIASFPGNIKKGMKRAHSVIILNEFDTGKPVSIINSGTISSIRTASVSGFLIKKYMQQRKLDRVKLGVIGLGPIGYNHIQMSNDILGDRIAELLVYDLNKDVMDRYPDALKEKMTFVNNWEEAYVDADIFMTCTVSKYRYIDKQPKSGALHLNVSLRDYKTDVFPWFKSGIVVDNWEEICRENTDIEHFHLQCGLQEDDVAVIQDFLNPAFLESIPDNQPIMFNPMGMAVFDIGIASYFLELAEKANRGVVLQ